MYELAVMADYFKIFVATLFNIALLRDDVMSKTQVFLVLIQGMHVPPALLDSTNIISNKIIFVDTRQLPAIEPDGTTDTVRILLCKFGS